ncbi:MAG TPA: hypothetical protein VFY39_01830 [Gammaproteobacteria bacterium]|nr:hypothetical protein [Gammaproteobacteria bacterium]
MRSILKLFAPLAAAAVVLTLMLPAYGQGQLKSPDDVKTGLRIINQVVGHTGRLIASKNYDTVPREHHEIVEGAEILRDALAKEPEAFRTKADGLLDRVVSASSALAELSKTHDDAKLATAHAALADAVHRVLDLFPKELQPARRN